MPTSTINTPPSFSSTLRTGIASVDMGRAQAMALQSDGKVVLGGYSRDSSGNDDFSVVRLNADGSLDSSFSGDGKAVINVGGYSDVALSLVVQSDGKVVLGGYSRDSSGNADYSVARLNADGSLDSSFSGDGKAVINVGGSDIARSLVVQSDGKVVLGGSIDNADFSVVRLNADGSLDSSFSGDGKAVIDVGGSSDAAQSLVVQSDGKVVLGGWSQTGGDSVDYSVVRLNADGSLDSSFGDGGKAVIDVGGYPDYANSVVVQADGKVVLGGYSFDSSYESDYSVVRLNADGSLDSSFGDGGKVGIGVGSQDVATSMAVQSDGKVVLGGSSNNINADFSVIRLNADGSLDSSFGNGGKAVIDVGDDDYPYSLVIQPDGKLILSGIANGQTTVVRLNADDSLDTTFGTVITGGSPVTSLDGSITYTENASSVILDTSVEITDVELATLNGGAGNYAGSSITLARSGGAVTEDVFSGSGFLSFSGSNAVLSGTTVGTVSNASGTLTITFNAAATQANVNAVLSAIAYSNTSDAPPASVQIDWTFSDGNTGSQGTGGAGTSSGSTTVNITALNDAPVISGIPASAQSVTAGSAAALADFMVSDPDGTSVNLSVTLAPTNGTLGNLTDADTNTAGIQLTGTAANINAAISGATFAAAAAGAASIGISVSDGVVASPTTGTYSLTAVAPPLVNTAPTFIIGTGKAIVDVGTGDDYGYSVIQQADGKLVLAGSSTDDSGFSYFSLVRLNADGSLDASFDGDGKRLVAVSSGDDYGNSVIQQADGKLVLAGSSTDDSGFSYFSLVRLNADGSLDTSFDGDGELLVAVSSGDDYGNSVIQQADGKLVLAGSSTDDTGVSYFSLVRLNADGSMDTSFDGDGERLVAVSSGDDYGNSLIQQADGKLVLAGYSDNGSNDDFSLIRLNTNGSLDTSFNGTGRAIIPVFISHDYGQSVTVQSDGKILVAGTSNTGGKLDLRQISLIRLNADGSLDTSFDTDGKAIIPDINDAYGRSITVQSDGKILVAGHNWNGGDADFSLIRVNTNGSLDTSFDTDGKLLVPVGTSFDYGNSVIQQADGKLVVAGYSFNGSDRDFSLIRLNADGSLDTSFGTGGNTLGASTPYTENASPVVLDNSVAVYDTQLAALNSGAGNYAGASLTLARQGGANGQDELSVVAGSSYTVSGSDLQSGGQTFATVSSTGGTLTLSFTGSGTAATQALVNDVLSRIAYANSSDAPPASVTLAWTFSDGNSGAQGTGGALSTVGTTTVNITAVNDAPTIAGIPATAQSVTTGQAAALADFTVADPDGPSVSLTVTLAPTNGTLGNLTDADTNTAGIQLTGIAASINAAIAGATFAATAAGAASIAISVSDGVVASPTTGIYSLTAVAPLPGANTAPTFIIGTGKAIVPVGSSGDSGYGVIQQADGKLVVAGTSNNGTDDFSVIRLNADGSLDTSFDTDGKLMVPVGTGTDAGNSVTVQSDGKILVAGYSQNGSNVDFSLIRLNANGSLDTSFNGTGKALIPVGSGNDLGISVTVQSDGKILVAGRSVNGSNFDFSLVRLNSNGSLDTGFNSTGKAIIPVGSGDDIGNSVTVQSDGKILVAGYSQNGSNVDFSLIRLNANGSLDTSFNGTGKALIPVGSGNDLGISVTVQSDGKILVAGRSYADSNDDFSLVRLNANGSLDTSFNSTGKAIVPVGSSDDLGYGITVQSDGKILVAGRSYNGTNFDFSLIRLNADGSLDTSFDADGKVLMPVGSSQDFGFSVVSQADGKLVVAGTSNNGTDDFSLIRLNADGSLDVGFNGANTLGTSTPYTENAFPVVLDSSVAVYDAQLAALNSGAGNYAGASLTLARQGGANGQDELSVVAGSSYTVSGNNLQSGGLTFATVSSTGGTLTLNFTGSGTAATQALVNDVLSRIAYANGSDAPPASVQIDWTFSDGNTGSQGTGGAGTSSGSTTVNITALNDAPVISGIPASAQSVTAGSAAALADFMVSDPDGTSVNLSVTLAPTNGTLGNLTDADTNTAGIQLTGTAANINAAISGATFAAAAAGAASIGISVSDGVVASPTTGTYSLTAVAPPLVNTAPTFIIGTGKAIVDVGTGDDYGYSVIQQADGKLVLAGSSTDDSGFSYFSLVRLNADGSLDASFDGDGKRLVAVSSGDDYGNSVIQQADGKLVLAGSSTDDSGFSYFSLVRLNADGSLDTSFDGDGELLVAVSSGDDYGNSVIQQADGKLVLAGSSTDDTGVSYFSLVRLNADGSMDTSFDGDGERLVAVSSGDDYGNSLIQQADGKLVLAGSSTDDTGFSYFSLVRLNADGSMDTSFDGDGELLVAVSSGDDYGNSVIQQADGKLVLAGSSTDDTGFSYFSLVRLNADGSQDTSFDGDGERLVAVSSGDDYGNSVIQQADGKLVLAGSSTDDSGFSYFSLVRLNADGSQDTSFDGDGELLVAVSSGDDYGNSVIQQADGKLVLAGYSFNGSDRDFSLIRLNADGSLDTSFGTGGNTLGASTPYTENASPVVLDNSVAVYDTQLAALNSGAGNYAGASITLARAGGANAQDMFSGSDSLSFSDGNAVLEGITVGTASQANGSFTITFNSEATQALVNQTLSSIAYSNTSDTPPASVQIDWTFNDGNSSNTQGSGGALSTTGSTTVNITATTGVLPGTSGNDSLSGTSGNDVFNAGLGNDTLTGGAGTDTTQYNINRSGLTQIGTSADGSVTITRSSEGEDYLVGIEQLSFTDTAALTVAQHTSAVGSAATPLYAVSMPGSQPYALPTLYSGPVAGLQYQLLGSTGNDIVVASGGNDFLNLLGGDDAANAGAGNDVIDGGTGSNFLSGGAGTDVFFVDGRGGSVTWSTITDWQAGEQLSIWGWNPALSTMQWVASAGAAGFEGATLFIDLDANTTIDIAVTWSGKTQAELPTPVQFADPALLWFL